MKSVVSSNERKYQTRNLVVQFLLRRFINNLMTEINRLGPAKILDFGCGEGLIAQAVLREHSAVAYLGYDMSAEAVERARVRNPNAQFQCVDLLEPNFALGSGDLVICLEVMEHLTNPEVLLRQIQRAATSMAIVSVPWEPFFRIGSLCRGMYWRRLGNHPEHVQAFGPKSFHRILSDHFSDVRIKTSFPWLLGICRP
jgi:SAM-dependent methyltransferase